MDAAITQSAIIYYAKPNKESRSKCGHAQSAEIETEIVKISAKTAEATKTNQLTMPLIMGSNNNEIPKHLPVACML